MISMYIHTAVPVTVKRERAMGLLRVWIINRE